MKNKRGLSTIVVTLIILVITLVSVGILYAIYTNILNQNKGQVDIQSKCLNAPINVVSATCVAVQNKGPTCTIYLEKGLTASTVPDQVKFSFIDKNGLVSDEKTNSWSTSAITITDIKKSTNLDSDITTVRVVPQFNVGGNYQDCAMIEKVI